MRAPSVQLISSRAVGVFQHICFDATTRRHFVDTFFARERRDDSGITPATPTRRRTTTATRHRHDDATPTTTPTRPRVVSLASIFCLGSNFSIFDGVLDFCRLSGCHFYTFCCEACSFSGFLLKYQQEPGSC